MRVIAPWGCNSSTIHGSPIELRGASTVERDAIGYLHATCGVSCHRPDGSAPFAMRIEDRMSTRTPREQMPPVGSHVVDDVGGAKLARGSMR